MSSMDLFIFLTSDSYCFGFGAGTLIPSSLWKLRNNLSPYHSLPSLHLSSLPTMGQYFNLASRTLKVEIPTPCMQSSNRDQLCGYASGLRDFWKAERNMILKTDFLTWGFNLIFRAESRNLNLEWLWGSSSCWVSPISLLGFIKGKMTY